MRRSALLGTMVLPTILLLGGCSGLGKFFGDTITLPGMNPNLPYGVSENLDRSRGQSLDEQPILPEPGNVWPGPPAPLPTLTDVARNQGGAISGGGMNEGGMNGGGLSGGGLGTGAGGPRLRDGGSMSMGENDAITHGAVAGGNSFSGGGVLSPQVPDASARYRVKTAPGQNGSVVIPNGDGTSTVIGPDGSVHTVKGTPK